MSRVALVILTVVLALVVLRLRGTDDVPRGFGYPDAYHYADIGRQLARGDGLTTLQTYPYVLAWLRDAGLDRTPPWPNVARFPLLPLVYAPAFRVAGASEAVVRRIGEGIWITTAVATALLAALLFGSGLALVVVAFQLLSLTPLGLARGGLPDQPASLAIVLATLGVALLARDAARSGTGGDAPSCARRASVTALVLGVGLGAAFLLRYDLLALLGAALVLLTWRRPVPGRRQALLLVVGCAVPVGAWLLHDALVTGRPATYLGLDRNLLGRAGAADVYASLGYESPWRALRRDPALLADKVAQLAWPLRNWRNLFGWSHAWLGPLALLSCAWLVRSGHPAARSALFIVVALLLRALLFTLTHHETRFYESFAPALLVMALGGVKDILERRWTVPPRRQAALAAVLVACFAATQVPPREVVNAHRFIARHDAIYDAIRGRTPHGALIASTETGPVAWFADRPTVRALPSQVAATQQLGVRIDGLLYPSGTRDGVLQSLQRQRLDGAFVEVSRGPYLTLWLRRELVAPWRERAPTGARPAQAG